MSELAERVSKLRARTWTKIGFDTNDQDFTQRYDKLIEQALLAERKSVWEEAAKICDEPGFCCSECVGGSVSSAIAKSLRAAAEKEVL